jgi:threonylcarbamoyladenosine tRNA methylthiotransferase MtaB
MDRSVSRFHIHTLGCKINTFDTGFLQEKLTESGYHNSSSKETEIHIINSCAVTDSATRETIRRAKQLKRQNPQCFVVITGCAAQVEGERIDGLEDVDLVVGNTHKEELARLITEVLSDRQKKVFRSDILEKEDLELGSGIEASRTRAFVKIQDGCDCYCSYCIVPYARGHSRSVSSDYVIGRIKNLSDTDVQEVVLTGVHIAKFSEGLECLVARILAETGVQRLRLSSLEPPEITDSLLQLFNDDRLCPHFHVSVQSGSDRVLRDMKRSYTRAEVKACLERIHSALPHSFVGMDVIVGFPGETEAEFQETVALLESTPWTRIHVFPYSRRKGTTADEMPGQLPESVKTQRAETLRHLSDARYRKELYRQKQTTKKALALNKPGQALARDYWPVSVQKQDGSKWSAEEWKNLKGKEHTVLIEEVIEHATRLEGELAGIIQLNQR